MKIRGWRLLFFIILAIFCFYFLFIKISPHGRWSCQWKVNARQSFFSGRSCFGVPAPQDRYLTNDYLTIIGDPVYFSLYTPRTFDKLFLTVIFKTNLSPTIPIIEAGLLVDKNLWQYKLQPVYNYWLENNFFDWLKIEEENWSLWQKNTNFSTINEWLEDLDQQLVNCSTISLNHCLALYNLSSDKQRQLIYPSPANLSKSDQLLSSDVALRGRHSFYFYLQNADLSLDLQLRDLNQNTDLDPIEIIIYTNQQIIFQEKWEDDRTDLEGSGQFSEIFPISVSLNSLPSALYRLDININDDLVIEDLQIKASSLVARQRLWPYRPSDQLSQLLTDFPAIQVKVLEPAAYQKLLFAGQTVNLDKAFKQIELIVNNSEVQDYYSLELEHGGPLIEGPGVFSWSKDLLFNPDYQRLDRFYNQQAEFVLANYQAVTALDNDWWQADLEIDLRGVYREQDKYNLIFSIPGLKVEDEQGYFVEIKELQANFSGRTLREKIKSMMP